MVSFFTCFPLDHSVVVRVAGGGIVVTLSIGDFWGMTISASSVLRVVLSLEAVEGEGAAAVVMDGLWRLVLFGAVDTDDFFLLSSGAERAVFLSAVEWAAATVPPPTTDFFALVLFLVPAEPTLPSDVFLDEGIVRADGGWLLCYCG